MNFTPINRLLGGYEEQQLDLSRADGANITYNDDGTITLGEGYAELEFTGIDARVGSIGFDVDFGDSAKGGKVCADFRGCHELLLPHESRKAHARQRGSAMSWPATSRAMFRASVSRYPSTIIKAQRSRA